MNDDLCHEFAHKSRSLPSKMVNIRNIIYSGKTMKIVFEFLCVQTLNNCHLKLCAKYKPFRRNIEFNLDLNVIKIDSRAFFHSKILIKNYYFNFYF